MRRGSGQPLLHVAEEFSALRIDRIAGVQQSGIRAETPGEVVDGLIMAHGVSERGAGVGRFRHLGKLAFIGIFESDAFGVRAVEIALDRGIVQAGIEVGQIPFWQ